MKACCFVCVLVAGFAACAFHSAHPRDPYVAHRVFGVDSDRVLGGTCNDHRRDVLTCEKYTACTKYDAMCTLENTSDCIKLDISNSNQCVNGTGYNCTLTYGTTPCARKKYGTAKMDPATGNFYCDGSTCPFEAEACGDNLATATESLCDEMP